MTTATDSKLTQEPGVQILSNWSSVVERIRSGDPSGMGEIYDAFSKGIRFLLYRKFGPQDLSDKVHDCFVIVAQAICNGELRQPERLMGYVHTVVRRQAAAHIDRLVHDRRNCVDMEFARSIFDKRPDPERQAIEQENLELAMSVLQSIPKRDRDVLTRFYLDEESAEEICKTMDLTDTQFRLIKSRAKTLFGERGKRRLANGSFPDNTKLKYS
jgi:RNA polymerase sigma-70 factor, ECF subfamily